jgi:hypothetical protein
MTQASGPLAVELVDCRKRRRDWLRVPYVVFDGDPAWVPPLLMQEKQRISPRHNPFFTFGEAAFFIVYRSGQPVGRISAQVNRRYQQHYGCKTGHFGFFDCCDDVEASDALVAAASDWLKSRGCDRVEGPFSLSVNEETGLLVEGFNTPAALLMNHARPYMGPLLEQVGLSKVMDTFAYRMTPRNVPPEFLQFNKFASKATGATLHKRFDASFDEVFRIIIDIYNDAWRDNWGFVPYCEAEIAALIKQIKPFLREELGRLVTVDGQVVAMIVAMPDINGIIKDFGGRLLPFNWIHLVRQLQTRRFRSVRVPLMGIRKSHRNVPIVAAGITALLVGGIFEEAAFLDLDFIELSWVLETNKPMNALGRIAAGAPAKRYRIYGKPLA